MWRWLRERRRRKLEREKYEEQLEELLASAGGRDRKSEEADKALKYCKSLIDEYDWWFNFNEKRWAIWQIVVIIGGVVATIAGVVPVPASWASGFDFGWLRGVPAGIVTIASGFLSSFTYREDAVRMEMTATALWTELAKFQTHAAPY